MLGRQHNGVSSCQKSPNSIREKKKQFFIFCRHTDKQTNTQTESKTDNNRFPSGAKWRSKMQLVKIGSHDKPQNATMRYQPMQIRKTRISVNRLIVHFWSVCHRFKASDIVCIAQFCTNPKNF